MTIIYIRLLDEGTDVFRPTEAEELNDGTFRIFSTLDYDPEDENWEFLPGQIVKCEKIKLSRGIRLVATTLVK